MLEDLCYDLEHTICSFYHISPIQVDDMDLKVVIEHLKRINDSKTKEVEEKVMDYKMQIVILASTISGKGNELMKELDKANGESDYDEEIGDIEGGRKLHRMLGGY